MVTTRAFLSPPKKSLEVNIPLPPTAPKHETQNFVAQSLPTGSADSWDLLYPIQVSHTDVLTFTLPSERQRPSLRIEALLQTRVDLLRSAEESSRYVNHLSYLYTLMIS